MKMFIGTKNKKKKRFLAINENTETERKIIYRPKNTRVYAKTKPKKGQILDIRKQRKYSIYKLKKKEKRHTKTK